MEHFEIEKSRYGTLKTLFTKSISFGRYSLLFNIDQAPNSKAKRYVFTFRKSVKKINSDTNFQSISSRGIFIVYLKKNIRLGLFNRHQIIETVG